MFEICNHGENEEASKVEPEHWSVTYDGYLLEKVWIVTLTLAFAFYNSQIREFNVTKTNTNNETKTLKSSSNITPKLQRIYRRNKNVFLVNSEGLQRGK